MDKLVYIIIILIILVLLYLLFTPNKPNNLTLTKYIPHDKTEASVLVLSCIDLRFIDFLHHNLSKSIHNDYDNLSLAGASLGALTWKDVYIKHVEIAYQLHKIREIWIIDHMDCGMYKKFYNSDDTDENLHIKNMIKVKELNEFDKSNKSNKFPIIIRGFIMDIQHNFTEINL